MSKRLAESNPVRKKVNELKDTTLPKSELSTTETNNVLCKAMIEIGPLWLKEGSYRMCFGKGISIVIKVENVCNKPDVIHLPVNNSWS